MTCTHPVPSDDGRFVYPCAAEATFSINVRNSAARCTVPAAAACGPHVDPEMDRMMALYAGAALSSYLTRAPIAVS